MADRAGDKKHTNYTAIVYFHGIGTPRRQEEISRIVDSLDQFAEQQDVASVGRLRRIHVGWEPSRVGDRDDVTYVEVRRLVQRVVRGTKRFFQEGYFRIYEGFWSPRVAGGYSAPRVIVWFLGKFLKPPQVMFQPWRTHQRLKLVSLYRMASSVEDKKSDDLIRRLEDYYRDFESWPARRKYPRGSFRNFIKFVAESNADDEVKRNLIQLAWNWRLRFSFEQILITILSLTLLAAIGCTLLLLFVIAIDSVSLIAEMMGGEALRRPEWLFSLPVWAILPTLVGVFYALSKVQYYTSYFLSDVMFWAIREEKDQRYEKRREIIEEAERILLHVMSDDRCSRIVVMGHSLGSAIAYQALLKLGRRWEARNQAGIELDNYDNLAKISHFVTVGCPIDRIHYFFDLQTSQYHRFNRIQDRLQGSTNEPPFRVDGKPGTRWINIWDDADPVCSRLFSPRKRSPNRDEISDFLSRSSFTANPIGAHLNYFYTRSAMEMVFWVAIFGRLPRTSSINDSWTARLPKIFRFATYALLFLIIWLAVAALAGFVPWSPILILTFALIFVWLAGIASDYFWPFNFISLD